ncbi:hypothetical protein CEK28_08715 [Xenophilus sp. AP218F]|nr:hypothetical protein CEK28_08715 [Xenophilus sp. AP218F]
MFGSLSNVSIGSAGEVSCQYAIGSQENGAFTLVAAKQLYLPPDIGSALLAAPPGKDEADKPLSLMLHDRLYQHFKKNGEITV